MTDLYTELLDATISELESLKHQGRRFVPVAPETLKTLARTSAPAAQPARSSETAPPRPQIHRPEPASSRSAFSRLTTTSGARTAPAAPPTPEPDIILTATSGKVGGIQELRERAFACQKCPNLVAARKNVVFGVGTIDAELMFVGEAPGAEEDEQGEPFVGRAGQLLTKIIQTMGLTREEVYIANILKCRPDTPGQSHGNRPPTPEEMERCIPYLRAQIDLIKPKVIVALGATAVEGLFGKVPGVGITKLRGRWKEFRGIPVMPTYHPSYLLRPNPNNIKREAWEDMLQVMARLGMPISEKQRGYFLNKGAA